MNCLRTRLVLGPDLSQGQTCPFDLRPDLSKTLKGWTCLAAGLVPSLLSRPDLSKNFEARLVLKLWGGKCLEACSVQKFRAGNVSRPVIVRGRDSLGAEKNTRTCLENFHSDVPDFHCTDKLVPVTVQNVQKI